MMEFSRFKCRNSQNFAQKSFPFFVRLVGWFVLTIQRRMSWQSCTNITVRIIVDDQITLLHKYSLVIGHAQGWHDNLLPMNPSCSFYLCLETEPCAQSFFWFWHSGQAVSKIIVQYDHATVRLNVSWKTDSPRCSSFLASFTLVSIFFSLKNGTSGKIKLSELFSWAF